MAQEKNASLTADIDHLDAKDGDFLTESRRATLVYMPKLSYHPEISVKGTRYFMIVSVRVKPGHVDHFVGMCKMVKAAYEISNSSDHYAAFRFTMGAPAGSYVILAPMKSVKEVDQMDRGPREGLHRCSQ